MVDGGDISSAIPPAISQAPKEKSSKVNETSEANLDVHEKPKKYSKKVDDDITKIRAKHAQEQAAQRWVIVQAAVNILHPHVL